jgi:DNA-binding transcriptional MerR regulator
MRADEPGADAARLLTITAAAQRSGITRSTLSSWVTRGLLPAVRADECGSGVQR